MDIRIDYILYIFVQIIFRNTKITDMESTFNQLTIIWNYLYWEFH